MTIIINDPLAPGAVGYRESICLPPEADAKLASLLPLFYARGLVDPQWGMAEQLRVVIEQVVTAGCETVESDIRDQIADGIRGPGR